MVKALKLALMASSQELDRRWEEYKLDPSSALTEDEFREQALVARRR